MKPPPSVAPANALQPPLGPPPKAVTREARWVQEGQGTVAQGGASKAGAEKARPRTVPKNPQEQ